MVAACCGRLADEEVSCNMLKPDVDATSPVLRGTLSAMRRWIRFTQTMRGDISWVERMVRASLMVPVFSLLVLILRLRALRWGRARVIGTTADGDTFVCRPPGPWCSCSTIWLFGIWEPDLTAFIASRLEAGDTFIDVGANIGVFSMLASHHVGSTGSVVAIEASPRVYGELLTTLELNGVRLTCVRSTSRRLLRRAEVTIYSGPAQEHRPDDHRGDQGVCSRGGDRGTTAG